MRMFDTVAGQQCEHSPASLRVDGQTYASLLSSHSAVFFREDGGSIYALQVPCSHVFRSPFYDHLRLLLPLQFRAVAQPATATYTRHLGTAALAASSRMTNDSMSENQ
jgi:hypothetical protein